MLDDGEVTTHTVYGRVQVVAANYINGEFLGATIMPLTEEGIDKLAKDELYFSNLHFEHDKNKLTGA